jgi:hypothetical protein
MTRPPKRLHNTCCAPYCSIVSRGTCTNAGDLQQLRAGPPENRRHSTNSMLSPVDYERARATANPAAKPGTAA